MLDSIQISRMMPEEITLTDNIRYARVSGISLSLSLSLSQVTLNLNLEASKGRISLNCYEELRQTHHMGPVVPK